MKADKVLKEIEKTSVRQFLPIVGPDKGKVLVDVIKKYKPKRVLEVGTLVGYSAILMSQHLAAGGKVVSIEINAQTAKIAKDNIKKAGFESKVDVVIGDAIETIPKLKGTFDILFLDAAKEEYLDYLKTAEDKLSKNTIVVADNVKVFEDAMKDYLDYVRGSGKYKSKTYDTGHDAIEVSISVV